MGDLERALRPTARFTPWTLAPLHLAGSFTGTDRRRPSSETLDNPAARPTSGVPCDEYTTPLTAISPAAPRWHLHERVGALLLSWASPERTPGSPEPVAALTNRRRALQAWALRYLRGEKGAPLGAIRTPWVTLEHAGRRPRRPHDTVSTICAAVLQSTVTATVLW